LPEQSGGKKAGALRQAQDKLQAEIGAIKNIKFIFDVLSKAAIKKHQQMNADVLFLI
jgi:hypothetical protein